MAARRLSNPVLLLILVVADDRAGRRIYERAVWATNGSLRHVRWLRSSFRENVDHRFAGGDKVVGDDPTVTSPPHSLGAHDGASLRMPELPKLS